MGGYAEQTAALRPGGPALQMKGGKSSGDGTRRTVWDKLKEAVVGVAVAGPVGAYKAGFGDYREKAEKFAERYDDEWQNNAARHATWQALLTLHLGFGKAVLIGNAHEDGSPDKLDSWVDQYNNVVGRGIGLSVKTESEIEGRVLAAMAGTLITSPTDPRIPANLRKKPAGKG